MKFRLGVWTKVKRSKLGRKTKKRCGSLDYKSVQDWNFRWYTYFKNELNLTNIGRDRYFWNGICTSITQKPLLILRNFNFTKFNHTSVQVLPIFFYQQLHGGYSWPLFKKCYKTRLHDCQNKKLRLKYGFCKKLLLLQMKLWAVEHICHRFWVGLLLHPPKSDEISVQLPRVSFVKK